MGMHYVRPPGQDFVVNIPRSTARDASLSYRARGVLQRLLSNAEGFSMTAADLAREGREGRDAVRAALRELKSAGYIIQRAKTNAAGQFTGTEAYVYSTPQPKALHREPENPLAGNPPAGFPTLKSSKSSNEQERSSSTRAPARVLERSAAAAPLRGKRHSTRPSGIECWESTDAEAAERIEAEQEPMAIAAAVSALAARDKSPAPGSVLAEIRRQRKERVRAAARAAVGVTTSAEADAAAFAATLADLTKEPTQ